MISPSRRKHPITRRNTRRENSRGGSNEVAHPSRCWGGAIVLVAGSVILWGTGSESAAAKELQWRKSRAVSKAPANPPAAKRTPAKLSQPVASEEPRMAKSASAPKRDSAVRPASFEEEGTRLQLSDASTGQASLRSVVVDGAEEGLPFRAAQLPADTSPEANGASRYEEELLTPFGTGETGRAPATNTPPGAEGFDPLFDDPPTGTEVEEELDVEAVELPEDETQMRTGGQETPPPGRTPSTFQPPQTFQLPNDDRLPVGPDGRPLPTRPETADELARERETILGICEEELRELKSSTLHDVDLRIGITGTEGEDFPFECTIDDGTWHAGRSWDETTYMWKASALCHKPLYFENESLERYGHSWGPCLDPLVSGAHFFTRLPVLPYCMGVEPPTECIYALGHYRPGSCAPYMIYPVPISLRGAAFQTGAVFGAAAILP